VKIEELFVRMAQTKWEIVLMEPHKKNGVLSLSHGHLEMQWPLSLTKEDVEDLTEYFRLTLNCMKRQAEKLETFNEARLRADKDAKP
jgi:hypothetical protein